MSAKIIPFPKPYRPTLEDISRDVERILSEVFTKIDSRHRGRKRPKRSS